MVELLQRRDDGDEVLARLEEAERLVAQAGESIDDPFAVNELKEAEFAIWKVRTELAE